MQYAIHILNLENKFCGMIFARSLQKKNMSHCVKLDYMEKQRLLNQFIEENYQKHRRELEASERNRGGLLKRFLEGGRIGRTNEPNLSRGRRQFIFPHRPAWQPATKGQWGT
jgi:hypothetical protein